MIRRALSRRKIEAATLATFGVIASFAIVPHAYVRNAVADAFAAARATTAPTAPLVEPTTTPVERPATLVDRLIARAPVLPNTRAAIATATRTRAAAGTRATMGLPNIEHPRVRTWITRFTTTHRGSMAIYLRRKDRYEPMITQKLAARGMPEGLIYLAMIESGFNPSARSPVKAMGLWQFMAPTAREYGLKVGGRVDERRNPARSTDAALRYLNSLHRRFGSWYLAAAAYNTGQGRVARVLKQVTGKTRGTDADYYRIAHRLPQETRDYVPKMIAAARIGTNPAQYGFSGD